MSNFEPKAKEYLKNISNLIQSINSKLNYCKIGGNPVKDILDFIEQVSKVNFLTNKQTIFKKFSSILDLYFRRKVIRKVTLSKKEKQLVWIVLRPVEINNYKKHPFVQLINLIPKYKKNPFELLTTLVQDPNKATELVAKALESIHQSRRSFLKQSTAAAAGVAALTPAAALAKNLGIDVTKLILNYKEKIKSILTPEEFELFEMIEKAYGIDYVDSMTEAIIKIGIKENMEIITKNKQKLPVFLKNLKLKNRIILAEFNPMAAYLREYQPEHFKGLKDYKFNRVSEAQIILEFCKNLSIEHYKLLAEEFNVNYHVFQRFSPEFLDAVYRSLTDKNYQKGKPAATFILNREDLIAFHGEKPSFDKYIRGYRVFLAEVENEDDLYKYLLKIYKYSSKMSILFLGAHGQRTSMGFGKGWGEKELLDIFDYEEIRQLNQLLTKKAIIILLSCWTGGGEFNIARIIFETLNEKGEDRIVFAPNYPTKAPTLPEFNAKNELIYLGLIDGKNKRTEVKYDRSNTNPRLVDLITGFEKTMIQKLPPNSMTPAEVKSWNYYSKQLTIQDMLRLRDFYHGSKKGIFDRKTGIRIGKTPKEYEEITLDYLRKHEEFLKGKNPK